MTKKKIPKETDVKNIRKEFPYLFEKELIENQNKRKHLVTKFIFTKDAVTSPLEGKFYSKYKDQHITRDEYGKKYWDCVESMQKGPREKYSKAVLESHVYGWIQNFIHKGKVYPMNVAVAPIVRGPLTKYGEILYCSKITERPAFHGKRFYVR